MADNTNIQAGYQHMADIQSREEVHVARAGYLHDRMAALHSAARDAMAACDTMLGDLNPREHLDDYDLLRVTATLKELVGQVQQQAEAGTYVADTIVTVAAEIAKDSKPSREGGS